MNMVFEKSILESASNLKMTINSFKGDIRELDINNCIKRMSDEISELEAALNKNDYEEALLECADIFNFLLATVHHVSNGYTSRKEKGAPR